MVPPFKLQVETTKHFDHATSFLFVYFRIQFLDVNVTIENILWKLQPLVFALPWKLSLEIPITARDEVSIWDQGSICGVEKIVLQQPVEVLLQDILQNGGTLDMRTSDSGEFCAKVRDTFNLWFDKVSESVNFLPGRVVGIVLEENGWKLYNFLYSGFSILEASGFKI